MSAVKHVMKRGALLLDISLTGAPTVNKISAASTKDCAPSFHGDRHNTE